MKAATMKQTLLFAAILGVVALPVVPLLLWSFSEQWFYPAVLPQKAGFRAWHYIFSTAGSQIMGGLSSGFFIAAVTSIVSLFLGIPAGRALGLHSFKWKKAVVLILVLPIVVPPISVSMGLHLWFLRLGLTETSAGVILVHLTFCLPYTVLVMWGVFSDFNPAFEQQARSLGATRLQTFFYVTLPMIIPGITIAALFSFLLSWSQYLCTLIIGGGKILTLPILLFSLISGGDRPVSAAVSLVFVIPVLFVLMASAHRLGRHGLKGIR